jgi:hypothetical protein
VDDATSEWIAAACCACMFAVGFLGIFFANDFSLIAVITSSLLTGILIGALAKFALWRSRVKHEIKICERNDIDAID